jgi:hypothetical protein
MSSQASIDLASDRKPAQGTAEMAPAGSGGPGRMVPHMRSWGPFLAVLVQFLLIVQLIVAFHLESVTFSRVMWLAFGGFLIHHLLPMRFRMPFFAMLSVIATVAVLRPVLGGVLLGIGLGLLGICHLPIAFGGRVGLLGVAGLALSVARAHPQWAPQLGPMWPILGSMSGLRIIVYLYDLKHRSAPFSFARSVSYFFMLPNVCFPLFPVVDYKTFATNYYQESPARIYQTGIRWMFRGVIQLLLYRLVYHFGLLEIESVFDARDVAEFMVATYLLYLHVSGQFHLIVGVLHMFGFNLPETHHLYLLASSFTDFWRRINIYWKDFIMKVFFYPAFFALRKMGTLKALALATLGSFLATWALHSWQWFWFLGRFLVTWQDVSFWAILALLVLANALNEAVSGRRRALSSPRFSLGSRLVVGLKTVGTFVVICMLWTLWSCHSVGELKILAESATRGTWIDVAVIVGGLAGLGAAGMVWGIGSREVIQGKLAAAGGPLAFWRSVAAVGAGSVGLLVLAALGATTTNPVAGKVLKAMRLDQLNGGDRARQRRGYYEELDDVRASQWAWSRLEQEPPDWVNDRMYRERKDFLRRELVPSATGMHSGAHATINRWGMHDHDYEKHKPEGRYRIILMGSSHEVGMGMPDGETFENICEDLLNDDAARSGGPKYEILNLAMGGYAVFRKLVKLEREGFAFEPDEVIFMVNSNDRSMDLISLSVVVRQHWEIPYPYFQDVFRRAGVVDTMSDVEVQRRLKSFIDEMYHWAFRRLAEQCKQRGVRLVVVYRPTPLEWDEHEPARRAAVLRPAIEAGIEVLDLSPAYRSIRDPKTLIRAPWDDHTNALGHRLLGQELHAQLAPRLRAAAGDSSGDDQGKAGQEPRN